MLSLYASSVFAPVSISPLASVVLLLRAEHPTNGIVEFFDFRITGHVRRWQRFHSLTILTRFFRIAWVHQGQQQRERNQQRFRSDMSKRRHGASSTPRYRSRTVPQPGPCGSCTDLDKLAKIIQTHNDRLPAQEAEIISGNTGASLPKWPKIVHLDPADTA